MRKEFLEIDCDNERYKLRKFKGEESGAAERSSCETQLVIVSEKKSFFTPEKTKKKNAWKEFIVWLC